MQNKIKVSAVGRPDLVRPSNRLSVSAIVPTYNEAGLLPATIARLKRVVDEIVVVDNGSTDGSSELARRLGVKVVFEPRKVAGIGYGFAHMRGMREATGGYIVAVDADGEHPIEDIPQIVEFARRNRIDFVSCARVAAPSLHPRFLIRRAGIILLSLNVRLLFGRSISDILSGMWLVKRQAVPLLSLEEGGWNLSPEIKLKALTAGQVRFSEYPIRSGVRADDNSKQVLWKTGLQHLGFINHFWVRDLAKHGFSRFVPKPLPYGGFELVRS